MNRAFLSIFSSRQKPDQQYIQSMFDKLARRYDLFTLLTSFGQANRLRRETLKSLKPNSKILDLGCGTGDLVLMAVQKLGPQGKAVGLDFSKNMLCIAQSRYDRLPHKPLGQFELVQKRAEDLPCGDEKFDLVVSGFVLRNLYENIHSILAGVYRSMHKGGEIRFLDLTEPAGALRKMLFRFYMMSFVGLYGVLLFGKDYPIPYLPDSASRFFKNQDFVQALQRAGFHDVQARSFILGAVTLYQGTK